RGQQGGALEERRRRRATAPRLCLTRGALQLFRDGLVRSGYRMSPVPRAPLGIGLWIDDLRQGTMRPLSVVQRRPSVGGRANQGMTKTDAGTELRQTRFGSGPR